MFRMHRSFRVQNGKGRDGRIYMTEIADHLKDKYAVHCDTFLEIFGPATGTCHLMMDFETMAAFEAFWLQLAADSAFGTIQGKEADIAVEGSIIQSWLHAP